MPQCSHTFGVQDWKIVTKLLLSLHYHPGVLGRGEGQCCCTQSCALLLQKSPENLHIWLAILVFSLFTSCVIGYSASFASHERTEGMGLNYFNGGPTRFRNSNKEMFKISMDARADVNMKLICEKSCSHSALEIAIVVTAINGSLHCFRTSFPPAPYRLPMSNLWQRDSVLLSMYVRASAAYIRVSIRQFISRIHYQF